MDLNSNLDDILNNQTLNENNPLILSKVRGIIFFLEIDIKYIQSINEIKKNLFITESINLINLERKTKKASPKLFDIIELAIYFLYYKISNINNLRALQAYENDLDYLLESAHYINIYQNKNNIQPYSIQSNNMMTFLSYNNNLPFSQDFLNIIGNKTYYLIKNNNDRDDRIILTFFRKSLFSNNMNNREDLIIYYSSLNSINNLFNESYYIYYSNNKIIQNLNLSKYYLSKGINIYNINDEFFTNKCYPNDFFDFDLTQKYKKKNIYQNIEYINNCNFIEYNETINKIIFLCENGFDNINKNDNENIPY